jgi:hypothetical protein
MRSIIIWVRDYYIESIALEIFNMIILRMTLVVPCISVICFDWS